MIAAVHDQVAAGLDVITDGEQTRLDFNLSFYGYLDGHRARGRAAAALRARPRTTSAAGTASPASCARRAASAPSRSSSGCGASRPPGPRLKASVPGPVHARAAGCVPNARLPRPLGAHRGAAADRPRRARRARRRRLRGDRRRRAVDELLRAPRGPRALRRRSSTARSSRSSAARGIATHLCFGNYKGRAVAPRRYAPMFPAFLGVHGRRDPRRDGEPRVRRDRGRRRRSPSAPTWPSASIDVKSYWIEPPEEVADARAPLPPARARRSGSSSRPTAASRRPRAGRRGRSSRTSSPACGSCDDEL